MQSKLMFFSLNVDKQFRRQIQALSYLSTLRSPVSINELAFKIGCSIPTMRNDISSLNNELPAYVQIQSLGKEGYILEVPDGLSISALVMELAKETDVFRIIDSLFRNHIYTFDEMVSELFINPCTLRNILSHINANIVDFNISISTSPIQFVGSETDIRIFFYKFYYDFNDYFTADSDFVKNSDAYKQLIRVSRDSISSKIHVSHFRATLWIMIMRNRIQAKCYVKVDDTFKSVITATPDFAAFESTFVSTFASSFFIYKPPLDDIIWAYVALLHCVSYSEPSAIIHENKNYDYVLHREANPGILNTVNQFLALEFCESMIQGQTLDKMRAFLINLTMLSRLSTQFQRISLSTRSFIKESINEYYMTWMKNLYAKEALFLYPIIHRDDIALSLAMLHFSVMSQLKQKGIRVLFVIQGETGYDDFLIQQSKFMIPQNVIPLYVFDQPITDDLVKSLNVELVVTNYDSPEFSTLSCPAVQLSYIPSMSEWTNLSNFILNMSSIEKIPPSS